MATNLNIDYIKGFCAALDIIKEESQKTSDNWSQRNFDSIRKYNEPSMAEIMINYNTGRLSGALDQTSNIQIKLMIARDKLKRELGDDAKDIF